jgi:hypothetical protein
MIKECGCGCGKTFEGNSKRLYFSAKCRKHAEVVKRSELKGIYKHKPRKATRKQPKIADLIPTCTKPSNINPIASAFWTKMAPLLIKRGHLNVLSEDAFAELCDLYSRVVDIRKMIDAGTVQQCEACGTEITIPGNRSLLQLDDKWSVADGTQTQTFKESALSDLKRKYSARFLEYCKAFYLTPLSNRGNFGLDEDDEGAKEKKGTDDIFDR